MKNEKQNVSVVENSDSNHTIVTKRDVEGMTREELFVILREYEGQGRTLRFQENAATQEKKQSKIPYVYDFSWSWLVEQAARKGISYGSDDHWQEVSLSNEAERDVIMVRNVEKKKKRTVEASEDSFKAFDILAGRLPVSKALLMTEAIERFVKDVEAGHIGFEYRLR